MRLSLPAPLLFICLCGTFQTAWTAQITVNGYQVFVNGHKFIFKGVNYSPVPIGAEPRFQPYGDYFIPYYENIWKGDINMMREAGVNSIRLYAGNPDLNAGNPNSSGNWKAFLDYLYNGNNRPIYVFLTSCLDQASGNMAIICLYMKASGGNWYRARSIIRRSRDTS
jgi:hypothetical protein